MALSVIVVEKQRKQPFGLTQTNFVFESACYLTTEYPQLRTNTTYRGEMASTKTENRILVIIVLDFIVPVIARSTQKPNFHRQLKRKTDSRKT